MSDPVHSGKVTASSVGALRECASRLATSTQLERFCESNNLIKPSDAFAKENYSEAGTSLHEILARMPVYVPEFAIGRRYNYADRVDQLAEQADLDLNKFDRSMLIKMARRRDEHIQSFLKRVPFARKPNVEIEIHVDDARLYDPFYTNSNGVDHERSGLPDVMVTVKDVDSGRTQVLLLDYKTGHYTEDNTPENLQLASLTALASYNLSNLERVDACLLTRSNIFDDPVVVTYDKQGIAKCVKVFDEVSDKATTLLDLLNEDSPELEDELFKNAKVGSACDFCDGKACCLKLQQETKQSIGFLGEIGDRMEAKWAEIALKEEDDMTVDDIKEVIALSTIAKEHISRIAKLEREAGSLLAQYSHQHGVVAGVVEKEGKRKFDFKPDMKMDVEEVANMLMEAFPNKIRKRDVLAHAKITASPIRKLIAKTNKIKEDEVPVLLDKMLGKDNPFEASRYPSKYVPDDNFIETVRSQIAESEAGVGGAGAINSGRVKL